MADLATLASDTSTTQNAAPNKTTEGSPSGQPAPQATPASQIPKGLEKFAGEGGQLDPTKLGQSYLESEKAMREREVKIAQLEKTLAALSDTLPTKTAGQAQQPSAEDLLQKFVTDPRGFVENVLNEVSQPIASELSKTALYAKHPELKDEAFKSSVKDWVVSLPPIVRELEQTLEGSDFLMNLYKETHKQAVNTPAQPTTEMPSGTRSSGSQRFSRTKIKQLMADNPSEYARLLPEIEVAYRAGRVDP